MGWHVVRAVDGGDQLIERFGSKEFAECLRVDFDHVVSIDVEICAAKFTQEPLKRKAIFTCQELVQLVRFEASVKSATYLQE